MWLYRLLLFIAILALWQLASGPLIPEFFISKPSAIAASLWQKVMRGNLFFHIGITAAEAFIGFLVGAFLGTLAGVLLGRIPFLADLLQPFILAFYSLPKIALAPLFVLWIGIGIEMKIVLTATVVFFLVFLNTFTGVRNVSKELEAILYLMGANERARADQGGAALGDHLGVRGPADLGALRADRRDRRRADRLEPRARLRAGERVEPVRHRRRVRDADRDHAARLRAQHAGAAGRGLADAVELRELPARVHDLSRAAYGPSCIRRPAHHFVTMQTYRTASFAFDTPGSMSREARIARIDALANLLDSAILIPGTDIRFGLDAVIGLVPGIGDAITTALGLYIVNEARALGAPPLLIARMVANVALDGIVGAVPLLGDVFDVAFRANRRNMQLLRDHLDRIEGRRDWTVNA